MEIQLITKPFDQIKTDALVIFAGQDKDTRELREIDKLLGGEVARIKTLEGFVGKTNQSLLLFPDSGPARLLLAGLGKHSDQNPNTLRESVSSAVKTLRDKDIKSICFVLPDMPRSDAEKRTQALVEGLLLTTYQFSQYKSKAKEGFSFKRAEILLKSAKDRAAAQRGIRTGQILARAVQLARDLGNHPSNIATPSHMANHAVEIGKKYRRVRIKVLGPKEMKKEKMEAVLSVGQGSVQEPRFIILEYRSPRKTAPTVALVGKGITFDSGGISIKPADRMEEMKYDMAGAATVMGIIQAAAELELPLNLVGLIAATENLPSGASLKPGDIIRTRAGKTVEVINTDAEGRLVLADALDFAKQFKPALVIDYATLTGAIVVALGDELIGAFGNNDKYLGQLENAAKTTGEKIWPMPLEESYGELIKSDFADLRNIGTQRFGDSINAALFLRHFTSFPWIHLDIAGVAWATRDKPYRGKGATGTGVRLTVEMLKKFKTAKT